MGGFVQFENLKNKTVQDGKLILTKKSFYHVADLPDFAREKVLQAARRQIEAATLANYKIEWLISDKKAVNQYSVFTKFLQDYEKNIQKDAGLEQQHYNLIQDIEREIGTVDWDLLQKIERNA